MNIISETKLTKAHYNYR